MRAGLTLQGSEGVAEFSPAEDFSALGRELGAVRLVSSEQSNSSVVFDDALILKVFRRLEPGINPELEMLRFLDRAGLPQHPGARRLVRVLGRPAHRDARAPAGVRRRRDRRLGARARRDRVRARELPRPAGTARRGDRAHAHRARRRRERSRRSRPRSRASSRSASSPRPSTRRSRASSSRCPRTTSASRRSSVAARRCASSCASSRMPARAAA